VAKNILIFCDGTGNVGGILADEDVTNVYKLFRATRTGATSRIDPSKQIAFYHAGLGSMGAGGQFKIGLKQKIYNVLSQMTGLGITKHIIECYAAIIRLWTPGDRIYLFGFSRGAYTARCVGGVLGLCGIPTKADDGAALKLDRDSVDAVASKAVKKVYQHGFATRHPGYGEERVQLAQGFRAKHGSLAGPTDGAAPYFIGVWDTVAALGVSPHTPRAVLGVLAVIGAMLIALLAWLILFVGHAFSPVRLVLLFIVIAVIAVTAIVWAYRRNRRKYTFYDQNLGEGVQFARHALSIDEYRKDFARVPWADITPAKREGEPERLEQLWFAGNHADIGGGYPDNEARLSDITLKWMVDIITDKLPVDGRIIVDPFYLNLFPSAAGMQHDECKVGIGGYKRLQWEQERRNVPNAAVLHDTVYDRLGLKRVLNYDTYQRYRPEPLRTHDVANNFFTEEPIATNQA
jgi:uncharacterized protein (DUF2235 family)